MVDIPPDDEASLEQELQEIEVELTPGGYSSPLMEKVSSQRLTLELLAKEIPIVRAGDKAADALASGRGNETQKRAWRRRTQEAQDAKSRLFAAALPLIRSIAQREYRRRQQWGSTVPLEDLMQEAIVGFFKGINAFNPDAVRKSATNYLGQWILVEMRRSAETMDHDLQVGHDAGERFRRVRALRSRLVNDLGREPTDEEIAAASRNADYVTRPGMVGRAPAEGKKSEVGKGLTIAQVAEERAMRGRVGQGARFGDSEDAEESAGAGIGIVDVARVAPSVEQGISATSDPAEVIDEEGTEHIIVAVVARVLDRMRLPEQQAEIISRKYGLFPFEQESSAREIARIMGIHRERVSRVLASFAEEMTRPGGVFHQVVSTIPEDDLIGLGLGWIPRTLGQWSPDLAAQAEIPSVLTEPISLKSEGAQRTPRSNHSQAGVMAWFLCDYHDRSFNGFYEVKEQVPREWPCPLCQRKSFLIRIDET